MWSSCAFDDEPQFYAESFPHARKPHRCCECSAPIEPGEKHLYARGKWDGDFSIQRQHMLCRELCMLINSEDGCCGFGAMREAWNDGEWGRHFYKKEALHIEARALMARIIKRASRKATA